MNLIMINPEFKRQVEVLLDEKPPVVTLGAVQNTAVITRFKDNGIKVLPVVASVAIARRAVQNGADAIIAEGSESGGHIGETTTMVLVPLISQAVDTPVIAAGGIAGGASMAAAFCLGAEGVQIGTRFVCAEECSVHDSIKQKYLKTGDRATVVTAQTIGYPVRTIKNKLAKVYEEWEKDYLKGSRTAEEIEGLGLGKLREAMREGNVINGSIMAGQCVALVDKIQPAREIINEIVKEAKEVSSRLNAQLRLLHEVQKL